MFKLLSDLSTVQRKEIPITITGDVYVSGYSGCWVTLNGSGQAVLTTTDTGLAWPVWNESNRNGTQGWSPDVKQAKSVTVFFGKVRFYTDQFSASPSLGDPLKTGAGGKLATASLGSDYIVAYCRTAPFSYVHFGNTISVIEVETV